MQTANIAYEPLNKAIVCIAEPTRLGIALMLGRRNTAEITRLIYKIPLEKENGKKRTFTYSQYRLIYHHLHRMRRDGVIQFVPMGEETHVKDYVLTDLGRQALIRKGYKDHIQKQYMDGMIL